MSRLTTGRLYCASKSASVYNLNIEREYFSNQPVHYLMPTDIFLLLKIDEKEKKFFITGKFGTGWIRNLNKIPCRRAVISPT